MKPVLRGLLLLVLGEGPFLDEIKLWVQRESFRVKLVNLDKHTHYFRNVDFSARLHDDILRCCGGGQTSFEISPFEVHRFACHLLFEGSSFASQEFVLLPDLRH